MTPQRNNWNWIPLLTTPFQPSLPILFGIWMAPKLCEGSNPHHLASCHLCWLSHDSLEETIEIGLPLPPVLFQPSLSILFDMWMASELYEGATLFLGHNLAKAGNSQILVAFVMCLVVIISSLIELEGYCHDKLVIACNRPLLPLDNKKKVNQGRKRLFS